MACFGFRISPVTDREALHRAILADPDDDTLRLVYADALEEEGDSRRAAQWAALALARWGAEGADTALRARLLERLGRYQWEAGDLTAS